jgi:hypothetical protein
MPMYVMRCEECQNEVEELLTFEESESRICECGDPMRRVILPVGIVGAMPSKPITVFEKQIGKRFETNAEARAYFKENPGWVALDKSDPIMQSRRDFHRNGMDSTARALGFKDHEHKAETLKKEKKRKQELNS